MLKDQVDGMCPQYKTILRSACFDADDIKFVTVIELVGVGRLEIAMPLILADLSRGQCRA